MRHLEPGPVLAVRAIGGLHVVTLAWDFAAGQEAKKRRPARLCHRALGARRDGAVVERYFLRGIKRFKIKDEGLAAGHAHADIGASDPDRSSGATTRPSRPPRIATRSCPVYGKPKLLSWTTHRRRRSRSRPRPSRARRARAARPATTSTSIAALPARRPMRASSAMTKPDETKPGLRADEVAVARAVRGADRLHRPRRQRRGGLQAARDALRVPLSAGRQGVRAPRERRRRRGDPLRSAVLQGRQRGDDRHRPASRTSASRRSHAPGFGTTSSSC